MIRSESYFRLSPWCLELHQVEGSTKWLRSVFCNPEKGRIQSQNSVNWQEFRSQVNSNTVENTSGHEFELVNNPSSSSERNDVADVVWISELELNSLANCSVLSSVEDSTERRNQIMETVSLNTVPDRTSKIWRYASYFRLCSLCLENVLKLHLWFFYISHELEGSTKWLPSVFFITSVSSESP